MRIVTAAAASMAIRVGIAGALALSGLESAPLQAQQEERVPDAAVVDGKPRGLFVGRSLLSGKAICLLFLSDGRITRAIPKGGLERFQWTAHRDEHERDSGTWEIQDGTLRIVWGDGGVHEGQLEETATGVAFLGKRYWRPVVVDLSALAGTWESARGTAIAGGEGVNTVVTLIIETDGAYRLIGTTGGAVAGRAAATQRIGSGMLSLAGATMTLQDADGTAVSRTFLAAPGEPVTAFTLDGESFTRVR